MLINVMRRLILNANKLSLAISLLSFATSITSLCVSIKINNQVVEYLQSDKINQDKHYDANSNVIVSNIPDTTIIRKDGSRVEVRSYKANDSLNGIIVNNNSNGNTIDNEKVTFDSNEIVSVKNDTNETHNIENNKPEIKGDENIKITLPKNISTLSQEGVISGKYVIQAGAFKVKNQAQKQCEKIKKSVNLQGRQCQFVFKNNQYRVIIFPFDSKLSADEFAKILSNKKFPVLTKKNI